MHNIFFTYRTIFSDLDTQQHVNSNKYFDLFESGKYLLLNKIGLTKEILSYENNKLNQNYTRFKFISQVKDNEQLDINISLNVYKKGVLEWFGTIMNCEKKCFEINSVNKCNSDILNNLITKDEEMTNSSMFDAIIAARNPIEIPASINSVSPVIPSPLLRYLRKIASSLSSKFTSDISYAPPYM